MKLCKRRGRTAKRLGHPADLQAIVKCKRAHSETRYNPDTGKYERCAKPDRADEVTAYFEYLDAKASSVKAASTQLPERLTVPSPPEGVTVELETNAPLNYFKPAFYNRLPREMRKAITNEHLVPMPYPKAWRHSAQSFEARHGSKIREQYISLDEDAEDEELRFLANGSSDEDSDDDGSDDEAGGDDMQG